MATGTIPANKPIFIEKGKNSNTTPLEIDLSPYGDDLVFLVTITAALESDYSGVWLGHVRLSSSTGTYIYAVKTNGSHTTQVTLDSTGKLTIGTTASYSTVRVMIL